MAFNAAFEIVPSSNPSLIVLQDVSTGSDTELTGRTIYLYGADGQLFAEAIPWAIEDEIIELDALTQDVSLNIRVDWASDSPLADPSTYTYSEVYAFLQYAKDFLYGLTQNQNNTPALAKSQSYYDNKTQMFCEVSSAENCIDQAGDVSGAQQCILRYQYLMANQTYYF